MLDGHLIVHLWRWKIPRVFSIIPRLLSKRKVTTVVANKSTTEDEMANQNFISDCHGWTTLLLDGPVGQGCPSRVLRVVARDLFYHLEA